MAKQYLYVLSNPKHEGLLKIGGTDKHPTIRADQLSRQTAAIGSFQVVWYIVVPDWRIAEQMAFYLLKGYFEQKEYFKVDLVTVISIIQPKIAQFFDLNLPEIFEDKSLTALELKKKSLKVLAIALSKENEKK